MLSVFSQSEESLVTEIFTMQDPQKAKEIVEQYPETFNSLLGMYKSMGLDLNLQVSGKEQYKGGEILNIDLGLTADEIPDPEGQQAFRDILGDQLAVPLGFVGNYAVLGIGKNARSRVEALMDAVDAGSAGMGGASPAQFKLPEANNFFMVLSVPKMLKWLAKYAPEAPPDFDILDSPGVGMSASFAGEHVAGELVVPLAEMLAIKDAVQKIQMAESADQ